LAFAIEYRGKERAEFLDPKGAIEGPTTARFDELGNQRIEMDVHPRFSEGASSSFFIGLPAIAAA
jgi:hypothetical protein